MKLFLFSLAIPFVVCVITAVRMMGQVEATERSLTFPVATWFATALILFASFFSHRALVAVRNDDERGLRLHVWATLVAACLFTLCQVQSWEAVRAAFAGVIDDRRMLRSVFYLLTGMHALHVFGGMIFQAWLIRDVRRRRFWSLYHPGVQYAAWYWHFVDAAWIFLLVSLLFLL